MRMTFEVQNGIVQMSASVTCHFTERMWNARK